jgi:hypothetical protein
MTGKLELRLIAALLLLILVALVLIWRVQTRAADAAGYVCGSDYHPCEVQVVNAPH